LWDFIKYFFGWAIALLYLGVIILGIILCISFIFFMVFYAIGIGLKLGGV
jgi:hypothetical protein